MTPDSANAEWNGEWERLTQCRDETDTKTGKESSSKEERNGGGDGLENNTKIEHPRGDEKGRSTSKMVG